MLAFWPFNFDNKELSNGSNLSELAELTDEPSLFDDSDDLDGLEDCNLLCHFNHLINRWIVIPIPLAEAHILPNPAFRSRLIKAGRTIIDNGFVHELAFNGFFIGKDFVSNKMTLKDFPDLSKNHEFSITELISNLCQLKTITNSSFVQLSKEEFLLIRSANSPIDKVTDSGRVAITIAASTSALLLDSYGAVLAGLNAGYQIDAWRKLRDQRLNDKIEQAVLKEQFKENLVGIFGPNATIKQLDNGNFEITVEIEDPDGNWEAILFDGHKGELPKVYRKETYFVSSPESNDKNAKTKE